MLISEAIEITGGLSEPSKMPGYAYSIPARACAVGSKLRKIPGSTCSACYALKGRYTFDKTQHALQRRLESLDHPKWVEAMALLINSKLKCGPSGAYIKGTHFRWHDSGDLQSSDHLLAIAEVCRRTRYVRHWLPTREKGMLWHVYSGIADGIYPELPRNLIVRLSAAMIDEPPPGRGVFPHTSGVHSKGTKPHGKPCPAYKQGGACGPCRACWDKRVPHVSYPQH